MKNLLILIRENGCFRASVLEKPISYGIVRHGGVRSIYKALKWF